MLEWLSQRHKIRREVVRLEVIGFALFCEKKNRKHGIKLATGSPRKETSSLNQPMKYRLASPCLRLSRQVVEDWH